MITPLLQTTLNFQQAASEQSLAGSETTFPELVSGLLSGIMAMAALLVLLYFVWAGIEWISAGGDSSKIEKARTKIMQSVIGMIVLSAALAFFMLLQNFLGLEILGVGKTSTTGSTIEQGLSTSTNDSLRRSLEESQGSENRTSLFDSFRNRFTQDDESVLNPNQLPDEIPEGNKVTE